ncbi:radical SAM family heme chaperone HemW [Aliikangiella sp. G2MR2-5]|uniref:radical SAM family heme chaperone HemW n=1 Tax=Aliikangiella sp. G2MR2-5 TaxID=2788943 RepID=UPI0018A88A80|nr:radical SAM family heme chaperone HemW [Aliikangiella sp. G2MR2-5]
MSISQPPPLSLYIHVPWCVKKCPYCDFNSHQAKSALPEEEYINRLLFDLEQEMPEVWGRQLISIFIGGGTPSLLSPLSYEKLLSGIRALLPFHSDIEITMEANPGTAEAEKFIGFIQAGINRISMGVQSFSDKHLQSLGRIHSAEEVYRAFEMARDAQCQNINLDLMYALPEQNIEQAMDDLDKAIALAPEHLSWYQLTLEPNTLFYHQPPQLPVDDIMDEISEQGLEKLRNANYQRYEISAYSRAGTTPSVHNLNYWQFGDYLGIGAGAHGKITRADTQEIIRKSKKRNPRDYLNPSTSVESSRRVIPKNELPLEFMMNAMRLKNGVPQSLFFESTGLIYSYLSTAIEQAKSAGLIDDSNEVLCPSEQGYLFLNELLEYFMPEQFSQLSSSNTINIKALD